MLKRYFLYFAAVTSVALASSQGIDTPQKPLLEGARQVALLTPGADNPRNSEGSFIQLKDGRILFAYSKFSGPVGNDDAPASIVGRYSSDGGATWSRTDRLIVSSPRGINVMSVSFLRLHDGRIALFYVQKLSSASAAVYVRFSTDESRTWSAPIRCIHDAGYYVLNNDRVIQTHSGRIIIPVALNSAKGRFVQRGEVMAYLSDDGGKTWRRSADILICPTTSKTGLQEPGVVELTDGRIFMVMRTSMGSQYESWSSDEGEHWTVPIPSSIRSPLSPASIKRIPSTGDLLLVWNDHSNVPASYRASATSYGRRTPLTVAISHDDGRTWHDAQNLLADPDGCYCYTAIAFVKKQVLLAFSTRHGHQPCLSELELMSFPVNDLYRH